jgi:hypothetical protein
MSEERINFGEGTWARTRAEYGFYCAGDPGWLPATALYGRIVNLGTKDGLVYDAVVVTGVLPDGALALRPDTGRVGWPWQPEREPEAVGPGERLPVTEVARGFIHGGKL